MLGRTDRAVNRRRTEVHVSLRRGEIDMSGEFLDRPRGRAVHRQMRTERVPQAVHAALPDLPPPRGPFDVMLHDVRRQRRSIPLTQHAIRSQMALAAQGRR